MKRHKRLLIIGPDFSFPKATAVALQEGEFKGVYVWERDKAVRLTRDLHPDLILLEAFPLTELGWEMLNGIHTRSDTPILLVSDPSSLQDSTRWSNRRDVYFLSGPVSDNELMVHVRELAAPACGTPRSEERRLSTGLPHVSLAVPLPPPDPMAGTYNKRRYSRRRSSLSPS